VTCTCFISITHDFMSCRFWMSHRHQTKHSPRQKQNHHFSPLPASCFSSWMCYVRTLRWV
jgi:hypothetical protein